MEYPNVIIGIDPGQKGAIAILYENENFHIEDMPLINKELDIHIFKKLIIHYLKKTTIGLETIHAMPGQGVVSMFNMGRHYGELIGCIKILSTINNIKLLNITPQKWRKHFNLPKGKESSINKCCELFPEHKNLFFGPKGGKKDGRADALLIAKYTEFIMKGEN